MRTILVFMALIVAALAAPQQNLIFKNYHEEIGFSRYERIKAYEEAEDFDGSRIAGGTIAWLGQFPFMVGVIPHFSNRDSVCGASLLTHSRSLTAAHCWRHDTSAARSFTLIFGYVRLTGGGIRINTNQVEMHAQYNERNLNNDIAIIRHSQVIIINNISPIGLATGNNQFVGSYVKLIGFGEKGVGVGIPHDQPLSHVSVQVISNEECLMTYNRETIIDSTICTSGADGRNSCIGDSGGPVAIGNTLVGVISFGSFHGCTAGFPAGSQRITSFTSWIRARL